MKADEKYQSSRRFLSPAFLLTRKNARLQAKLKKVEEAGEAADAGASTAVSTVKMDIV